MTGLDRRSDLGWASRPSTRASCRFQPGLSTAGRSAYLALYNAAYVLPLALIVLLDVVTLQRFAMTEGRAKVLKLVSGVLLVAFGVVFLAAPGLLR